MVAVSLILNFVVAIPPKLSTAFCLHARVDKINVSAFTAPVVVMVLKFIPVPVTVGFTAGIAVIIFASQIRDLLGLTLPGKEPGAILPKLAALWQAGPTLNLVAVLISVGVIGTILLLRRFSPRVPGLLVAVARAAFASYALALPVETIGTRFGDDIITLNSGLAGVEIQSITQIGTNVTLSIYAQNIIGDPTVGVTTNLMVAFVPIAATVTDLGGGNYSAVVDVSGLGSSTGFFRAYGTAAPASAGSVTINADLLDLAGHTITNVAEIVFTNGWKIACTTNGLEFVSP
jgi:hypothetical protein